LAVNRNETLVAYMFTTLFKPIVCILFLFLYFIFLVCVMTFNNFALILDSETVFLFVFLVFREQQQKEVYFFSVFNIKE